MASFQAKIGWKSPRKSDSKNYRSVPLLPDAQQKIPKKQQKNSKNKKIALWPYFKTMQVRKGRERKKKEIIVSFCSCPTLNRKFQKNSIKNFKN